MAPKEPPNKYLLSAREIFLANVLESSKIERKTTKIVGRMHSAPSGTGRVKTNLLLDTPESEVSIQIEGLATVIDSRLGGCNVKRKRTSAEPEDEDVEMEEDKTNWYELDEQQRQAAAPTPAPGPSRPRGPMAAARARRGATARNTAANANANANNNDIIATALISTSAGRKTKRLRTVNRAVDQGADPIAGPSRNTRSRVAASQTSSSIVKGKGRAVAVKPDPEVDQITAGFDGFSVMGMAKEGTGAGAGAGVGVGGVGKPAGVDVGELFKPLSNQTKVGKWLGFSRVLTGHRFGLYVDSTMDAGTPVPIDFPGSRATSQA